jgi:hypothetical protein
MWHKKEEETMQLYIVGVLEKNDRHCNR